MQNNVVIVDMNSDSNIQYQVFVKDIDVPETDVVPQVDADADAKVITFITEASGKSRNGNLSQNKYQILANELTQELETHKQMITDKMTSLDKSQKVVTELQSVISKQNSQINDYATKAQMYSETIKDLHQKIDVLSCQKGESVSELQNENDNLNNELMALQSSILKLHQERDIRSIEMNQLQEQHQKIQDLLSAKIKELTLFQTEHSHFKNQVDLYKETNDKLQQELDTVKLNLIAATSIPVGPVELNEGIEGIEGIESIVTEEPGLDRVVGNIRVQRNVRRANPSRRR